MYRYLVAVSFLALGFGGAVAADEPTFELTELDCLPLEANAALDATVGGLEGGDEVRLYFRRLNPVGAFYYVGNAAAGDSRYWATFPRPEDREQHQLTDEWWEILQTRDWMEGRDRDWLENYLENREQEAAEYYVAVYDETGEVRGRSKTQLVSVEPDDCNNPLTPRQRGWADNLTVGETSTAQADKEVFHWLCDGIVTRIDTERILHPDEFCRACVVGFGFVPPLASVAGGVVTGAIIEHTPPASERQP